MAKITLIFVVLAFIFILIKNIYIKMLINAIISLILTGNLPSMSKFRTALWRDMFNYKQKGKENRLKNYQLRDI
jgi:hypothetical protein